MADIVRELLEASNAGLKHGHDEWVSASAVKRRNVHPAARDAADPSVASGGAHRWPIIFEPTPASPIGQASPITVQVKTGPPKRHTVRNGRMMASAALPEDYFIPAMHMVFGCTPKDKPRLSTSSGIPHSVAFGGEPEMHCAFASWFDRHAGSSTAPDSELFAEYDIWLIGISFGGVQDYKLAAEYPESKGIFPAQVAGVADISCNTQHLFDAVPGDILEWVPQDSHLRWSDTTPRFAPPILRKYIPNRTKRGTTVRDVDAKDTIADLRVRLLECEQAHREHGDERADTDAPIAELMSIVEHSSLHGESSARMSVLDARNYTYLRHRLAPNSWNAVRGYLEANYPRADGVKHDGGGIDDLNLVDFFNDFRTVHEMQQAAFDLETAIRRGGDGAPEQTDDAVAYIDAVSISFKNQKDRESEWREYANDLITKHEAELDTTNSTITGHRDELKRLRTELDAKKTELDTLRRRTAGVDPASGDSADARRDYSAANARVKTLIAELETKEAAATRDLNQAETNLKMLEESTRTKISALAGAKAKLETQLEGSVDAATHNTLQLELAEIQIELTTAKTEHNELKKHVEYVRDNLLTVHATMGYKAGDKRSTDQLLGDIQRQTKILNKMWGKYSNMLEHYGANTKMEPDAIRRTIEDKILASSKKTIADQKAELERLVAAGKSDTAALETKEDQLRKATDDLGALRVELATKGTMASAPKAATPAAQKELDDLAALLKATTGTYESFAAWKAQWTAANHGGVFSEILELGTKINDTRVKGVDMSTSTPSGDDEGPAWTTRILHVIQQALDGRYGGKSDDHLASAAVFFGIALRGAALDHVPVGRLGEGSFKNGHPASEFMPSKEQTQFVTEAVLTIAELTRAKATNHAPDFKRLTENETEFSRSIISGTLGLVGSSSAQSSDTVFVLDDGNNVPWCVNPCLLPPVDRYGSEFLAARHRPSHHQMLTTVTNAFECGTELATEIALNNNKTGYRFNDMITADHERDGAALIEYGNVNYTAVSSRANSIQSRYSFPEGCDWTSNLALRVLQGPNVKSPGAANAYATSAFLRSVADVVGIAYEVENLPQLTQLWNTYVGGNNALFAMRINAGTDAVEWARLSSTPEIIANNFTGDRGSPGEDGGVVPKKPSLAYGYYEIRWEHGDVGTVADRTEAFTRVYAAMAAAIANGGDGGAAMTQISFGMESYETKLFKPMNDACLNSHTKTTIANGLKEGLDSLDLPAEARGHAGALMDLVTEVASFSEALPESAAEFFKSHDKFLPRPGNKPAYCYEHPLCTVLIVPIPTTQVSAQNFAHVTAEVLRELRPRGTMVALVNACIPNVSKITDIYYADMLKEGRRVAPGVMVSSSDMDVEPSISRLLGASAPRSRMFDGLRDRASRPAIADVAEKPNYDRHATAAFALESVVHTPAEISHKRSTILQLESKMYDLGKKYNKAVATAHIGTRVMLLSGNGLMKHDDSRGGDSMETDADGEYVRTIFDPSYNDRSRCFCRLMSKSHMSVRVVLNSALGML
jgi:hypothetical protein